MTAANDLSGLTMHGEKRAADPRTLFRPGGKSIGELSRAIPAPADLPASQVPEFRVDAFLTGPEYAAKAAIYRARYHDVSPFSGRPDRCAAGLPYSPLNSRRVARGA